MPGMGAFGFPFGNITISYCKTGEFYGDCNVSDIKGSYSFISFILGNKTVFCPKIKERS